MKLQLAKHVCVPARLLAYAALALVPLSLSPLARSSRPRGDSEHRNLSKEQSAPTTRTNKDDLTHNGVPFQYHPPDAVARFSSKVHCIGENFNPDHGWMQRSCEFHNLCVDVQSQDFVVYPSAQETRLQALLAERQLKLKQGSSSASAPPIITISTLLSFETSSMPLGSIAPGMNPNDVEHLRWFPRVEAEPPSQGFYTLPSNFVFFPIHPHYLFQQQQGQKLNDELSAAARDDYWALFRLLDIFDLANPENNVVVVPVWTSACDMASGNRCREGMRRYAKELLQLDRQPEDDNKDEDVHQFDPQLLKMKSSIVCAPMAISGLGLLADDPAKHHAWMAMTNSNNNMSELQPLTHNIGRKQSLGSFSFSKGLLQDLGLFSRKR